MNTNLERFKREMGPARRLYARELEQFACRFDVLGEMSMREFPDIDVQEYIFDFEKVRDISEEELDEIYEEITNHMNEFCKDYGIEKFSMYACI